jgi:predicted DNA-binding transcriptional regulator YafY
MSFAKAQDLIRLAQLAATRRQGLTLDEIAEIFAISHRTAQRMTDALETSFAHVTWEDGPDRKRRWRLDAPLTSRLDLVPKVELEALEIAAQEAQAGGRQAHAAALEARRERLLAEMPRLQALRSEADVDAVLTAMGRVTRPGPRVSVSAPALDAVREALRGPYRLRVTYRGEAEPRMLDPFGLLLGHRCYLVARQAGRDDMIRNFRMDLISEAVATEESFPALPDFDLNTHAARAFGVWQDPAQYGEVLWRFRPDSAERAAGFVFHPNQSLEPQEDGSLIVRFHAAGWTEMAWHLYQWGDRVEVLAPQGLAEMVKDYRPHFDAMP